jgi:hypothetical protein
LEQPIKNRRENNSTIMLPAFRLFFIIRVLLNLISAAVLSANVCPGYSRQVILVLHPLPLRKAAAFTFQQKRRSIRDGLAVPFKDRGNQLF